MIFARAVLVIALPAIGCGGDHALPDAAAEAIADPSYTPACALVGVPGGAPFLTADDFGPIVKGTLAGWEPAGRWFLTGVAISGRSSVFFEPTGAGNVIVDRDPLQAGTLDDDVLFERASETVQGTTYVIALRISDRLPDGSLRADRASCQGGQCTLCTARMIRATHNADEGEGDHVTLLGQLNDPAWGPGYTFNVRVVGTTAYLIRQDGLHIIDTSDPAHPVEVGIYRRAHPAYSNDVKLVDVGPKRYAVIADNGVDIVDVTTPSAPVIAATITQNAHTVAIESRGGVLYAYFGTNDGTCPIYDITDPLHPVKLATYHAGGPLVHDLSVDNGIAYLNAWSSGFQVVDYTTPATPALVGTWAPTPTHTSHSNWTTMAGGRHIALHGEEAYAAHLDVVDVDPASATYMQSFATWKTRDFISIHNIMAFGTKVYMTYYQDGVRVLDVADPAHPAQIGYYNTWDPQADYATSAFYEGAVGFDVDPARHLVFVADSPRGLLVLDDTTP